jgi:hypothetical protein
LAYAQSAIVRDCDPRDFVPVAEKVAKALGFIRAVF